jgi:sec-independent protein translocase protein TatC
MLGFLRNRARQVFSRGSAGEMPFLDHLEELRWRVIWSAAALAVGTIIGLVVVMHFEVLQLLIRPIEPLLEGEKLHYLSPSDPIIISFKLAFIFGFMLALPVIVYQIWSFVAPALHPHEKRAIVPAFFVGFLLFMAGVAMAYFFVLPIALEFMMGFQTGSLQQNITVGPYASLVTKMLLAFGLVFELPVVIVVLGSVGLVRARFLTDKRRHAIVAFAIGASLITPADLISTIFMMIPLIVLYEISIVLVKVMERRRARELAAESAESAVGAEASAS